jgi:hypothetical protein
MSDKSYERRMPNIPSLAAPTYLGLIDDVVRRYPWLDTASNLPLDAILLQYLLFGGTLIINDGYLAANEECQIALAEPNSLLNFLGTRGVLSIASTREPVSTSIIARARGGVVGHQQLVARTNWPEIAARIDRLNRETSPTQSRITWPRRDLTANFALMTKRLLDSQLPADILTSSDKAFLELFLRKLEDRPEAPRTQWEGLAVAGVDAPDKRAQLMQLANQIYHLNFAAALGCEAQIHISAATWADARTMSLLGRDVSSVEATMLDGPVFCCDLSAAASLARRLLDDPSFLATRAGFLNDWQNPDARATYGDLLSQLGGDGDDIVAPPALLAFDDPDHSPRFVAWRSSDTPTRASDDPTGIMRIFLSAQAACIASANPTPFAVQY